MTKTRDKYHSGLNSDPEAVADIVKRREAGETLASIGQSYGVSRERIRQLCKRWGTVAPSNEAVAANALNLLITGKATSIGQAAELLGVGEHKIRKGAEKANIDLKAPIREHRSHLHDGRRFGMWSVISGSYRIVDLPNCVNATPLIDCRCDCGTERTVRFSNLIGGITRGCGCRSKTEGRKQTPWRCLETDEREKNSSALAKRLGIGVLAVIRRLNRGEQVVDSNGNTWKAVHEEAVRHYGGRSASSWICLDTGETWHTAAALAKHLGICGNSMRHCIKEGRTYCGADQRHYVPVGKEDLRRSKFVPRVGARQSKAA